MKARYCGLVKITFKHVPGRRMQHPGSPVHEEYRATFHVNGKVLGKTEVYLPKPPRTNKDYDGLAESAIAFAINEDDTGQKNWSAMRGHLESDGRGGEHISSVPRKIFIPKPGSDAWWSRFHGGRLSGPTYEDK